LAIDQRVVDNQEVAHFALALRKELADAFRSIYAFPCLIGNSTIVNQYVPRVFIKSGNPSWAGQTVVVARMAASPAPNVTTK
jgi:hypothetical protein